MIAFLLNWLPFLAKLGGLSKWFSPLLSFVPGGQVLAAIGGVFSAIASAIGWLITWVCADLADGLKEPQRLLVRMICFLLMLGVGAYGGIQYKAHKDAVQLETAREEIHTLKQERINADRISKANAAAAIAAGERAEAAERAKIAAEERAKAAAPVVQPAAQRVRRPAASAASGNGQGLFGGAGSLFGSGK